MSHLYLAKGLKRFLLASFLISMLLTPMPANAVSATPSTSCWSYDCTVEFPYTGDYYTWTVPYDGNYWFTTWGAQGGNAQYNGTVTSAGGKGGYAKGYRALTEGQIIYIYVGGQGASSSDAITSGRIAGGFNGGGSGYNGSTTTSRGGGGGGASDVRVGGSDLSNRVIVAGGGAGGNSHSANGTKYPGYGGGTSGGDGYTSTYSATSGYNGRGGTSSSGGAQGSVCGVGGTNGALGVGGNGESGNAGSGGGGGGYYGGGGGGCGTAAGGGSGWVGSLVAPVITAGNDYVPDPATGNNLIGRTGNGFVKITYSWALRVSSFTTSESSPSRISTSGTISYAISFTHSVSDFAAADLSFTGTSTCNTPVISGSGQSYTISVSNCSEGRLVLQLASQSITSFMTGPAIAVNSPAITIDRTLPTISSVSGPSSATYTPTTTPNFSVVFSETITISGSPRLTLTVGALTKYATYTSMSDSKTALFAYTVGSNGGEYDVDGISIGNSIDLNGGTITDGALNSLSSLNFTAPNLSSVLVAQPPSAPTITSVSVSSATVTIYFSAGATNGSTITNYQYATDGSTFKSISLATTSSPLVITTVSTGSANLVNGSTYPVKIRAQTSWGQGSASSASSVMPVGISTISLTLSTGILTASKGQTVGITAATNAAGRITYLVNGKRISGCVSIVASAGNKTCQWKPETIGTAVITAILTPTTNAYTGSTASLTAKVMRRSNLRY